MLRPRVKLEPGIAWGLGWALQETADGRACWHSGDNPGYKNFALAYPEARLGLVIMTNGDGGEALWEPLLQTCLGGEYPLFAWRARR
ncbi:MAG TPA: serine hydrolase [Ktedonobacteraceae bacterium]